MLQSRLAVLTLAATLLGGIWVGPPSAVHPDGGQLQGTWQITSVLRDGEPDRLQIGAFMMFSGDEVTFWPNALTQIIVEIS